MPFLLFGFAGRWTDGDMAGSDRTLEFLLSSAFVLLLLFSVLHVRALGLMFVYCWCCHPRSAWCVWQCGGVAANSQRSRLYQNASFAPVACH